MKVKNYFYSTLFGLFPSVFVINSLGSGLEKLYYALMQKYDNMKLQRVYEQKNIYPVFRAFFEKEQ